MQEADRLRGRTALITGGAKRIGRAITSALAAAGVNTVIHFNESRKKAEELARGLQKLGVRTWTIQADLARPAQVGELWQEAERLVGASGGWPGRKHRLHTALPEGSPGGSIDFLINNASLFTVDQLMDFDPRQLNRNLQVNTLAPLLLSRYFAARVQEGVAEAGAVNTGAAKAGAIVNLLDCRMVDYDREHMSYHLSKRLLLSLTRMMALELAPRIRVNGVAPGLILPPPGLEQEQEQEYRRRLAGSNPLASWGSPEEVAEAVLFLLRGRFITGQVIYVDGGRNLRGSVYG